MSLFEGSIFGKSAGKVAGLVFGGARTREGKKMTVRELVIPSNPQTPAQMAQRSRFRSTLDIVTRIDTGLYRTDWNNAVGKLAGYQSLFSRIQQASVIDGDYISLDIAPATVSLGGLHAPQTVNFEYTGNNNINVSWSTELGENGQDNDVPVVFAFGRKSSMDHLSTRQVKVVDQDPADPDVVRSDGSFTLTLPDGSSAGTGGLFCIYFRPGADSETDSLSPAKFKVLMSSILHFETDFSEYQAGSAPNDWTEHIGNLSPNIVTDASSPGGQRLDVVIPGTNLCTLTWDHVPFMADKVIRLSFRLSSDYDTVDDFNGIGPAGRIPNIAGNVYQRFMNFETAVGQSPSYVYSQGTDHNGTFFLGSTNLDYGIVPGQRYYMEAIHDGADTLSRVWPAGTDRPETPSYTGSSSRLTGSGRSGFGSHALMGNEINTKIHVDSFSVTEVL